MSQRSSRRDSTETLGAFVLARWHWLSGAVPPNHGRGPEELTRKAVVIRLLSRGLPVASGLLLVGCAMAYSPELPTAPISTWSNSASTAVRALDDLPVKGRAPKTGYSRDQFGQAWTDDVTVDGGHNGCLTREDILRRSMIETVIKQSSGGCVVLSGRLTDPYTGREIQFVRGPESGAVQVDHVVALGDSWQKGAQQLTAEERTAMANDPLELLAVDGATNSAKGDADAASWLPPNKGFRCTYVARQIAVKTKYRLWVTASEKDAMAGVLATCPGQELPTKADVEVPTPVR